MTVPPSTYGPSAPPGQGWSDLIAPPAPRAEGTGAPPRETGRASRGQGAPPDGPGAGPLRRFLRGRRDDPTWVRPGLLALLVGTGILYTWDLGASGWANSFYAAAVQAGTRSWKSFFFGSLDPSNFITVDKSPASLWVMEISARLFGLNSWSLLVPEALAGVGTVALLYLTVRRWFPPAAGLAAGTVAALTPVATLMFRFDNPDALMVLLVTVAAYATVRAVEDGRSRWTVAAGTAVGFAFLAKMLEAFLVVPALAAVVLLAGCGPLRRRITGVLWGGLAMIVSAGWWILAVELTPAADRPYIGGSQDNSLWNLMFGYNGFGRLTGNETGSVGGSGPGTTGQWGATGLTRLFGTDMGTQVSWLLPAALVLLVAGLIVTRRTPRANRTRAALILWGGWLLVAGLTFSLGQGIIHPYYTVALAPPVGALIGVGGIVMWLNRDRLAARAVLAATAAVTALWTAALLGRTPHWLPWLRPAVLVVGGPAALALLAGPRPTKGWGTAAAGLAAVACIAAPFAYSLDTVRTPHTGAIPSAGPAGASAAGPGGRAGLGGFPGRALRGGTFAGAFPPGAAIGSRSALPGHAGPVGGVTGPRGGTGGPGAAGGVLQASHPSASLARLLDQGARGYTWVAATVGANAAAGYQLSTGHAVMALGGFNGTDPYPSLAYFEKLVAGHRVHYFIDGGQGGGFGPGGGSPSSTSSAIEKWVTTHFTARTVGGVSVYDLSAGH